MTSPRCPATTVSRTLLPEIPAHTRAPALHHALAPYHRQAGVRYTSRADNVHGEWRLLTTANTHDSPSGRFRVHGSSIPRQSGLSCQEYTDLHDRQVSRLRTTDHVAASVFHRRSIAS